MPPEAAASMRLALLAVSCLAAALQLLSASRQQAGRLEGQLLGAGLQAVPVSPGAGAAMQRYCGALQQGLREFADHHTQLGAGQLEPLAAPGLDGGSNEEQLPAGGAVRQPGAADPLWLELSAGQLECLVVCLQGLSAAAAAAASGAAAQLQSPGGLAAGLVSQQLLPLLLALHTAGSGPGASRHQKLWWRAVEGLLESQPGPGGLGDELAGRLLHLAVAGLGKAHRSCLVPMLRCIRRVLGLLCLECVC